MLLGHQCYTVHTMANIERLLNPFYAYPNKGPFRVLHSVIIPSSPSPSVVVGFLSPACDLSSASLPPLVWVHCIDHWSLDEWVYIHRHLSSLPSGLLLQSYLLLLFLFIPRTFLFSFVHVPLLLLLLLFIPLTNTSQTFLPVCSPIQ